MLCPACKGSRLLQWPNFPGYERRDMGYSSPTRLHKLHNPLREGIPCTMCGGTGVVGDDSPARAPAASRAAPSKPIVRESGISRAEQMVRDGHFGRAEAFLDKTIKNLSPTERPRAHELRGIARFEQNKVKGAAQDFTEATKNRRWSPSEAHFYLGICMMMLGEYDDAISRLTEFTKRDGPWQARARLERGVCYIWKGRYGAAVNDLNRAVKLDRKRSAPLYFRGRALRAKKNPADALKDADLAIALDPEDAFSYLLRGDCLKDLRRISDAIDAYTDAKRRFTSKADRKGIAAAESRITNAR